MTEGDRQRLLAHLELTEQWLASELEGLSERQLRFRAGDDTWSIADVVEHLAIAEPQYWKQVEDSLARPLPATPTRRRRPMPASSGTASTAATGSAPAKRGCPTAVQDAAAAHASFVTLRGGMKARAASSQDDLRGRPLSTEHGRVSVVPDDLDPRAAPHPADPRGQSAQELPGGLTPAAR